MASGPGGSFDHLDHLGATRRRRQVQEWPVVDGQLAARYPFVPDDLRLDTQAQTQLAEPSFVLALWHLKLEHDNGVVVGHLEMLKHWFY